MNARDLYQAAIMDHARAPRRAVLPAAADASARLHNPLCGDRVDVGVRRDGDTIAEIGVVIRGCALCIAAGSMMAERLAGAPVADVALLRAAIDELIESDPPSIELGELETFKVIGWDSPRRRCVTLPFEAMVEAVSR